VSWIKVDENLHEKREVLQMARMLKTRPEHVAGYCIRFWGWVSRQSEDGIIRGVDLDVAESVLGLPHFLGMMRTVGWLEYIEDTSGTAIIIPNFDRHLSNSAKNRAIAAEKKRMQRARGSQKSVPVLSPKKGDMCPGSETTREEKIREELKKESKKEKQPTFKIPTVEQVAEYAKCYSEEKSKPLVDAETFHDHYTQNGWLAGKVKMKDWKAAVRLWSRRHGEFGTKKDEGSKYSSRAGTLAEVRQYCDEHPELGY